MISATNERHMWAQFAVFSATVLGYVHTRDPRMLLIGGTATGILYLAATRDGFMALDIPETTPQAPPSALLGDTACQRPTRDNPFANRLIGDPVDRLPACKYEDVKDEVEAAFDYGLPREFTDIYRTGASDRQFMTMPVTDIVPDTIAFANFLYGRGLTCKEATERCEPGYVRGGLAM